MLSASRDGPVKGNCQPEEILVDNEEELLKALTEISSHKNIAFDAEGIELGRDGPLTVATFGGLDTEEAPIFVVDVQVLGGERVFSRELPSFRSCLEDLAITKVTFDCRGDSDALFHQFDVTLCGVLDLQVFDQAVRIHAFDEAPPENCPFVKEGGIQFLQGVETVLGRYPDLTGDENTLRKLPAPHRLSSSVWGKRPLSTDAIAYAANDVRINKVLWNRMQMQMDLTDEGELSELLMRRVEMHSKRYEGQFRDRRVKVNPTTERNFVMEEHAIISSNELPASHPRHSSNRKLQGRVKWDDAVRGLQSKDLSNKNKVYNACLFRVPA